MVSFSGTTCPRYFQVIGSPKATGSKRGISMPSPMPFSSMKNCSTWITASIPSEPGCTGSWKKWALKYQSSASMLRSALTRPRPSEPPSVLAHGLQKLFGFFGGSPGAMPAPLLYGAGGIELVGGLMVMLGLRAGIAAFIASGTMAVAYFMVHQKMGVLPIQNHGEY